MNLLHGVADCQADALRRVDPLGHLVSLYGSRRECADCHGEKGEGHAPIGPPLAAHRAVTMGSATNLIRMVLFGGFPPGTQDHPRPYGMPPYYPSLSDEQIANVLTFVRSAWGNAAGPVFGPEISENRGNPLW